MAKERPVIDSYTACVVGQIYSFPKQRYGSHMTCDILLMDFPFYYSLPRLRRLSQGAQTISTFWGPKGFILDCLEGKS